MNRRTDRRILKILLPGFRIPSESSTDFPVLQLQRIADSSTFWARILEYFTRISDSGQNYDGSAEMHTPINHRTPPTPPPLLRVGLKSGNKLEIIKNTFLCRSIDSFRYFWMGPSSFGCNDNVHSGAVLHSFRRRLPFQFHDLYRFEVKDFKTDMISNDSNGRKVHSMFLSVCFFFLQSYSSKTFQEILQTHPPAKKAKINKHRGQLTCPRAQPHFQIRLAPKFRDGAGR